LRYETTPVQLRSAMDGVGDLLSEHAGVDPASVRVRFVRFGASSLDVDIFAYVLADDWNNFLEIQEELLFGIMNIVQKAGTRMAFPSQTLYIAGDTSKQLTQPIPDNSKRPKADALHDALH
jgi:MscS family membrane protein